MKLNEFPIIRKRYLQLLRVIQFIHICLFSIGFVKAFMAKGLVSALGVAVSADLVMVVLMQILIMQVKAGRVSLAVNIHQLLTLFFLVLMALINDGLRSSSIAAFPISMLVISLYTRAVNYLIYFSIILLVVVGIGLNDILVWIEVGHTAVASDRIVRLLVIYGFTGFLSWTLIRDLRFAYTKQMEERERLNESKDQLQQLADTDQLTGLLNRYGVYNHFDTLRLATDFKQSSLVLLFVDVDDFKTINDQHGHHIGDAVLTNIGQRLQGVADSHALVSRLGGDEFVIALRHDRTLQVNDFVDSVLKKVSNPLVIEGVRINVTTSVGVVVAETVECTFDDLSRKADMAMYQAKVDGKNHYCYYNDDLAQAYMANLQLLKGVQEAVEKDGLALHYQPKLDTETDQIVGAEALLRWEKYNPAGHTAGQIIPVIETTNLIHEVGYWALRQACQDCKTWFDEGFDLPVSVNVSPKQFTDLAFAENVKKIIDEVGLPASSLMLEVAEDALVQEGCDVITQLQQLKEYGVKLSIDCFGVGHSNLAYLADLEVDELKMDKGFTKQLSNSYKARSIMAAFVKMANQMGIRLVALGVESKEDNRTLQSLGCVTGQGFLWQKAIPSQEFGQFIR